VCAGGLLQRAIGETGDGAACSYLYPGAHGYMCSASTLPRSDARRQCVVVYPRFTYDKGDVYLQVGC